MVQLLFLFIEIYCYLNNCLSCCREVSTGLKLKTMNTLNKKCNHFEQRRRQKIVDKLYYIGNQILNI